MAKNKTAKELKVEFTEARKKEIDGYNQELSVWLEKRDVYLKGVLTLDENGSYIQVFVKDKL